MTRIRKLFLGIFLMVFTLGIGVFIFVQVDSKDAGTGKSRPLSMAEKILKYDDDLNAYVDRTYDKENANIEEIKKDLYKLKEIYPYFSYASLDEFYKIIMAEYEGDDDAILIIYGTSNWNTSASYEDEELNRCVERAAAEASWQEQQRDPEQKKLRKELYYLKKHHPEKSYEELYANIENVHHDVITTEEWYVINHVDMSDELMEYVDSLLPEADEEELKAIFERTFGPVKRYKEPQFKRTFSAKSDSGSYYRNSSSAKKKEKEYLLVDGYNIIYAWEDLKELADANLHAAQTKLMDILSNYQGFKTCTLILVFDAYKIEGHAEEVITYHNIHVVYTKEAETADQYIEKTVHKIGRENQVTVATSDGLEQIIIMGQGAHRMSARGLRDEIKATENQIRQQWHEKRQSSKNYLIDNISDEMAQYMKEKRLGKQ